MFPDINLSWEGATGPRAKIFPSSSLSTGRNSLLRTLLSTYYTLPQHHPPQTSACSKFPGLVPGTIHKSSGLARQFSSSPKWAYILLPCTCYWHIPSCSSYLGPLQKNLTSPLFTQLPKSFPTHNSRPIMLPSYLASHCHSCLHVF